ncbi:hypothetical protein EDD22DRAFT_1051702 [Suillus occidentalis]|nr:hypothetical protein EDD22DRAFT_1051702 [Suillus occidentalis]
MSSGCHKVLGSFADVPAVIRINDASPDSTVCNVPRSVFGHNGVAVESSSGPVRVPTVDGWYNSRQTFRSVYLNGCDVELGCDWLAFVNAKFDGSQFLRPSEMDLVQFGAGHTWNFHRGDDISASSSVTQAESSLATQAGSSSTVQCSYLPHHNDCVVDDFFDGYETLRRSDLSSGDYFPSCWHGALFFFISSF